MIAIVKSSFNSKITDGLYKGCISALNQNGFSDDKIETHIVPGAFEIPYQTKKLLSKKHSLYQAVITCLLYTSPSPRDQRGSRMPSSA